MGNPKEVESEHESDKPCTLVPVRLQTECTDPATQQPERRTFSRGDSVEIAGRLIEDLTEEGGELPVHDLGKVYGYRPDSGLWSEVPREAQSQRLQSYAGKPVMTERGTRSLRLNYSQIAGAMDAARDQLHRPGYFRHRTLGVHLLNGFLHFDGDALVLRPHSAGYRCLHGIPMTHDRDASCERFQAFLNGLFVEDEDGFEKIAFLQEFVGACLFGIATQYQICAVLLGCGLNGKSTLQEIISALFPSSLRAAVPPQKWKEDYFLAKLPDVHLNCVSEMPNTDLLRGDTFKQIISGEEVCARSVYKEPFSFKPIAGHLFASNELPVINDQSFGLWRRFCLIEFNRQIRENDVIPGLAKQIVATEMNGILSWAIEGAVRLRTQGRYTSVASSCAGITRWQRNSDTVSEFIQELKEETTGRPALGEGGYGRFSWARASELYLEYRIWSDRNGYRFVSNRKFKERMNQLGLANQRDREGAWYPVKDKQSECPDAEWFGGDTDGS